MWEDRFRIVEPCHYMETRVECNSHKWLDSLHTVPETWNYYSHMYRHGVLRFSLVNRIKAKWKLMKPISLYPLTEKVDDLTIKTKEAVLSTASFQDSHVPAGRFVIAVHETVYWESSESHFALGPVCIYMLARFAFTMSGWVICNVFDLQKPTCLISWIVIGPQYLLFPWLRKQTGQSQRDLRNKS